MVEQAKTNDFILHCSLPIFHCFTTFTPLQFNIFNMTTTDQLKDLAERTEALRRYL